MALLRGIFGHFKCPADMSRVTPSSGPFQGRSVPRVRSMAMSLWFGGFGGISIIPRVRLPSLEALPEIG